MRVRSFCDAVLSVLRVWPWTTSLELTKLGARSRFSFLALSPVPYNRRNRANPGQELFAVIQFGLEVPGSPARSGRRRERNPLSLNELRRRITAVRQSCDRRRSPTSPRLDERDRSLITSAVDCIDSGVRARISRHPSSAERSSGAK
jgi:hypothetical protein